MILFEFDALREPEATRFPVIGAWLHGRLNAAEKMPKQIGYHAYMNPTTAALGLQRLACLPKDNEDLGGFELFDDLSTLGIWK